MVHGKRFINCTTLLYSFILLIGQHRYQGPVHGPKSIFCLSKIIHRRTVYKVLLNQNWSNLDTILSLVWKEIDEIFWLIRFYFALIGCEDQKMFSTFIFFEINVCKSNLLNSKWANYLLFFRHFPDPKNHSQSSRKKIAQARREISQTLISRDFFFKWIPFSFFSASFLYKDNTNATVWLSYIFENICLYILWRTTFQRVLAQL